MIHVFLINSVKQSIIKMSRPLGFIKFMPKKIMDRSIPLRHEKKNSF